MVQLVGDGRVRLFALVSGFCLVLLLLVIVPLLAAAWVYGKLSK